MFGDMGVVPKLGATGNSFRGFVKTLYTATIFLGIFWVVVVPLFGSTLPSLCIRNFPKLGRKTKPKGEPFLENTRIPLGESFCDFVTGNMESFEENMCFFSQHRLGPSKLLTSKSKTRCCWLVTRWTFH